MVGDEPLMLKRKNPNALVIVCANRIQAINYIIKNYQDVEVILLDDGFQHMRKSKIFMIIYLLTQV